MISIASEIRFDGQSLRRKLEGSVSDHQAHLLALKNPLRYKLGEGLDRPDLIKARQDALREHSKSAQMSSTWVKELLAGWTRLTGLDARETEFWRERGLLEAVKAGRDVVLRRYIGDDGWAWFTVYDTPGHWMYKKRLPESVRQAILSQKRN